MNDTAEEIVGDVSDVNFDDLYPALVTCFTIILTGYVSGRVNLISQTEVNGIHTFITYFSLPSLIFVSMINLDMSSVNFRFILAILLAKCIVFFVVMLILLVVRPLKRGKAGLLAVFTTQSNDFAIGYPIVSALYNKTHPTFASYMYLLAPVNLAILNPIAFILMELDKLKNSEEQVTVVGRSERRTKCIATLRIIRNIIRNPIILSTILGVVCNFIFSHKLPIFLKNFLEVLGSAFSACALFSLGMKMVGKVHTLQGIRLIVPGLLILAKLLLLPVLIREIVSLLNVGGNEKDTSDWSTFGFLYGTLPTAPTVFVFSVQYGIETDLVATSMVACTFVSAPLMFISAKMITLTKTAPSQYIHQMTTFMEDISIISLIASAWVLIIFVLTKKICKIPHKFTACLVVSQVFSCVGSILFKYVDHKDDIPSYIQFGFFNVGVYSCRLWTAIIAMALLFMESRSLCFILFKLQPFFMLFGWGLPIVLTVLLLLFDKESIPYDQRNPNFVYGDFQAIIVVSLLVLCFIVTAGCLILHEMYRRRHERYSHLSTEINRAIADHNSDTNVPTVPSTSAAVYDETSRRNCVVSNCCSANQCSGLPTITESGENTPSNGVTDIEDLFSETSEATGNGINQNGNAASNMLSVPEVPVYCHGIIQQYQETIDDDLELIEEELSSHDPQVLRHIVLLIFLLCSMFVGLAVSIWTLIMEKLSGIYIELAFLDVSLNFGQSIIVFAVFGTDTKDVLLPLLKRWRKLCWRTNKLILPMHGELSAETLHICEQFKTHHLDKCENDIAANRRWRLKTYEQVFSGRKLVDWLIDVGLARDRIDAINYARHLLEGRVIRHINDVFHFYDKNLLYTFE